MRRFMYIALGILTVLVILVFTGQKSVHHEIFINAPKETVWNVLTDMEKYPAWNPVMELLDGSVKEGNSVKYRFTQDAENNSEIGATVVRVVPNELLNQKGGIPLVLTYNHRYILNPVEGGTKVIIHEDYAGIGVNFWNPDGVEKAYGRLNEALKSRSESVITN